MRLLFIGGTSFVGRHAVELAVAEGHAVTVFHRGRTNPGLLDGQIEHRLGDREIGDYRSIEGRESWDAVIDVCAYVPRHVDQLADVLGGRCGHYVQVSSVSAMTRLEGPGLLNVSRAPNWDDLDVRGGSTQRLTSWLVSWAGFS